MEQPDKWSSEALFTAEGIAERQKARTWRMQKLKMAGLFKKNPGFDFLIAFYTIGNIRPRI